MRAFLHSLAFSLVINLSSGSLIATDINSRAQIEESDDDLEQWLAAAKRVPAEILRPCPSSCSMAMANNITSRAGWYLFPDLTKLALCNETMLLDMVVKSAADENTNPIIRACSASLESVQPVFAADNEKASFCTTANRVLQPTSVYIHQPRIANDEDFSINHLLSASEQMKNHLALQQPSCTNNAVEFAYSQSSSIGLFAGVEVHQHGITSDILDKFTAYAREKALTKTTVVQVCQTDERGADYSFGIIATSAKNLPFVQEAVRTWASGSCVSGSTFGEQWMEVDLRVPTLVQVTSTNNTNSTGLISLSKTAQLSSRLRLVARADCRTSSVQSGDGC